MWHLYRSMISSRWTCRWPGNDTLPLRRLWGLATVIGCAALLAGCSETADSTFKQIVYRPTPDCAVLYALQDENPDARRRYLRGLIDRKELKQDWAVKAFNVIARTDADPQVRCVAVQGLAQSQRPEAVDTAVAILDPRTTTRPVRSGQDEVRLDCMNLLLEYLQANRVPQARMDAVRQIVLKAAGDDQDHQVRMAAVRGLRYFPGAESLKVLVTTLRESDFGLQFEAEMSLRHMTGHVGTFDADPWDKWLAAAKDPYAGRMPTSRSSVRAIRSGGERARR